MKPLKISKKISQSFLSRLAQLKTYFNKSPFVTALIFIFISWMSLSWFVYFFEEHSEGHNITSYGDSVWWGIVTLLTVGYGDRFPVSIEGRWFAGLLMICGVVGIAIVTAKISSYFLERALRERRGFVDTQLLQKHFVICGWKDEMSDFLLHILDSNKNISDSDIVLVNNVSDSEIESMLAIPRLKKVKIIKGDFFIEIILKRAAPERAEKILILADATPNQGGQIPTMTEADARTIMTAMTLNSIAKGTPVVAEILDSAMDQYLKLAHVNEIIYSRDYSRLLLAQASNGTGVSNIFHDLLNPHAPYFIATEIIPEVYLNGTYEALQNLFKKSKTNQILIGILENSGNSHVAKENAIRKAQQTPDISQLVANLQGVKNLRFNQPIFGPTSDYVIKEGSMAIVIDNRGSKNV